MMKKLLLIGLFLLTPSLASAAYPGVGAPYGHCKKMVGTAGGASGGIATTTTVNFALAATSTNSRLAATSSAGYIAVYNNASSTPIDIIVTNGTDCDTDAGSVIPFTVDSYSSTTGELNFHVSLPVSSTSAPVITVYYGYAGDTDVHVDDTGTFSGLGEVLAMLFGTSTTNWDVLRTWDRTATQIHGSLDNFFSSTSTSPGLVGSALTFDGDNDNVVVADNSALDFTNNFTIAMWLYDKSSTRDRQLEKGDSYFILDNLNSGASGCSTSGSEWVFLVKVGGTNHCTDALAIHAYNQWDYVVGLVDNSTMSLYVDGVFQESRTFVGDVDTTALDLVIGGDDAGVEFNGIMDEVRFYKYALHPMDILTNYNNQSRAGCGGFWTCTYDDTPPSGGGATPITWNIHTIISGFMTISGSFDISN